jgi:hypothetical protein
MGILVSLLHSYVEICYLTNYRIVAMVCGFCGCLLFFFVPETFWDRTPRPKKQHRSRSASRLSIFRHRKDSHAPHFVSRHRAANPVDGTAEEAEGNLASPARPSVIRSPSSFHRQGRGLHVGFAQDESEPNEIRSNEPENADDIHLAPGTEIPSSPPAAHLADTQHLSGKNYLLLIKHIS